MTWFLGQISDAKFINPRDTKKKQKKKFDRKNRIFQQNDFSYKKKGICDVCHLEHYYVLIYKIASEENTKLSICNTCYEKIFARYKKRNINELVNYLYIAAKQGGRKFDDYVNEYIGMHRSECSSGTKVIIRKKATLKTKREIETQSIAEIQNDSQKMENKAVIREYGSDDTEKRRIIPLFSEDEECQIAYLMERYHCDREKAIKILTSCHVSGAERQKRDDIEQTEYLRSKYGRVRRMPGSWFTH